MTKNPQRTAYFGGMIQCDQTPSDTSTLKLSAINANIRTSAWHVWRKANLPGNREAQTYLLQDNCGKAQRIILKNRNRQVIDALIRGPIFAASPVRLSNSIMILRREYGVEIETHIFSANDGSGGVFGIYELISRVKPIDRAPASKVAA